MLLHEKTEKVFEMMSVIANEQFDAKLQLIQNAGIGPGKCGPSVAVAGENISQLIYLEQICLDYPDADIHELAKYGIRALFQEKPEWLSKAMNHVNHPEWILENVFAKIYKITDVNNLDSLIHWCFLDLVLIPYVCINDSDDVTASFALQKNFAEHLHLSQNVLFTATVASIQKTFARQMNDVLKELNPQLFTDDIESTIPLWVVTNSKGINGACGILNKTVLDNVAEQCGDLVILPSSTHEILLAPLVSEDLSEFTEMIRTVNTSILESDEVLNNHPYIYRKSSGCLEWDGCVCELP